MSNPLGAQDNDNINYKSSEYAILRGMAPLGTDLQGYLTPPAYLMRTVASNPALIQVNNKLPSNPMNNNFAYNGYSRFNLERRNASDYQFMDDMSVRK